jgi:O-antigen ligase/polysaccharide polymerase Wzy-like membrane protein
VPVTAKPSPPSARRRTSGLPARGAGAVAVALLVTLGLGSGVSGAADGYYDLAVWGPICVAMCALVVALAVATAGRPRLVPALAVGGLVALWLWSWLSTGWAESADEALVTAGRWALYAATLTALMLLMRSQRDRWLPLAAATAGVMAVALYVLLRMLDGDADVLFSGGRLENPLGYVNGQAGYFLLAFWACVALAEQARSKALAGLGAAGAVVLGALLVLSQTRAVLPAVAVSAIVMLAVVPGRRRRIWVLVAVGLGLLVISQPLLDVYRETQAQPAPEPELIKEAARLTLLAAVIVGAAWATIQALLDGLGRTEPSVRTALRRGEALLAGAVVLVALVVATAALGDVRDEVREQYDNFVHLRGGDQSATRFLSGGGNRYDYWRIAWLEFKDAPVRGQGAGNYDRLYFAERRTVEDIRQPHSLPLQALAELGVVGALMLFAFIGAVFAGLWRTARQAKDSAELRIVAVAGGGAFVAWLAHTSVDWLHNLPGVTGIALCAAAALVAPWSPGAGSRRITSARIVVVVAVCVAAIAAAYSVGRLVIADHYRIDARDTLRSDPVEALRLANQSLAFNDESLPALYVKAAAYARLGRYRAARGALIEAIRREPHDHVPWVLLGDLAVRRGDFPSARRFYRRASELNPRSTVIRALARNPRAALPGRQ